jgi:tetratricopeptide (TPR) repeat protein
MIAPILWLFLASQSPDPAPPLSPEAMAMLQAGADAERRRDLDTAVADFRRATELAPNSAVGYARLGNAFLQKKDYDSALPALRKAAELSPDFAPVQKLLGFALLTRGYAAEAIPHLDAAHEYGALGIAQLQENRPADAVMNLQRALEKNPADPDLLYYLSRASDALASQSLDRLLTSAPNSQRAHQALGQAQFASKQYDAAAKEYQQAIAMRPDLPGLHLELGQVYAAEAQWPKAEAEFRAEAALQPGNAEAAYRLGDALMQQGKMKEAAAELKRSDALRPDMPETLYALGKASAAAGDNAAAEKSLDRVIALEQDSPLAGQTYLALATIHRRQGKTDEASKDMQEFRRIQSLREANAPKPQ